MEIVECSAFIMIKNNQILVEKRKLTKAIDPGLVAIPGGHCEKNESIEETLIRETREELGIIPIEFNYLCSLLHNTQELEKINYFVITKWEGKIQNHEAESIFWIDFNDTAKIDIETDRIAVNEYFRHYKSSFLTNAAN